MTEIFVAALRTRLVGRFPKKPANVMDYFNIQNSQALWFELTNRIMGLRGDLALAKACKALEPSQELSFDDDAALNELFYIHAGKCRC